MFRVVLQIALLSSFVLLSAACTSLNSKAEKLMAEKSYEDAEKIYLQILRKHPQDVDALIGLKKAREGVISSQLLLVRRERLSGNTDQANEQLNSILEKSALWKVYPTGAVAFTQNEETEYAIQSISQHTNELLSLNHPLKVAFLLDHFKMFFQEKNLSLLDRMHKTASQQGLARCRQNLQSTPMSRSFYLEFLARECRYWGDARPALKQQIQHGLVGHLDLQGSIQQMPPQVLPILEQAFNSALEQTAWYEASSLKHVRLTYQGQFSYNTFRREKQFTKSYQEQVAYQSSEAVTKYRTEMHQVTNYVPGPDGQLTPQTTMQPEQVSYVEMEEVTRFRSETRYFYYTGYEIEQNISLNASGDLLLPTTSAVTHLSGVQADRNLTTESTTEVPRIGLYSRIAKIYDLDDWSKRTIEAWRQQIRDELSEAWNQRHCATIQASNELSAQADEVFACMRNTNQASPPAVDAWLQKNLGLPSLELQSLLM